jgi:hypothetical protein
MKAITSRDAGSGVRQDKVRKPGSAAVAGHNASKQVDLSYIVF